jgi:hypothetical protein
MTTATRAYVFLHLFLIFSFGTVCRVTGAEMVNQEYQDAKDPKVTADCQVHRVLKVRRESS